MFPYSYFTISELFKQVSIDGKRSEFLALEDSTRQYFKTSEVFEEFKFFLEGVLKNIVKHPIIE